MIYRVEIIPIFASEKITQKYFSEWEMAVSYFLLTCYELDCIDIPSWDVIYNQHTDCLCGSHDKLISLEVNFS